MKLNKLALTLTVVAFATSDLILPAKNYSAHANEIEHTQISMRTGQVKVDVSGLVCAFCARGIEKSFGKIDNVENLKVDLEAGSVTFNLKDGSSLTDEVITKSITENGISVDAINTVNKTIDEK